MTKGHRIIILLVLIFMSSCSDRTGGPGAASGPDAKDVVNQVPETSVVMDTSGVGPVVGTTSGIEVDPYASPTNDPQGDAIALLDQFKSFKLEPCDWTASKGEDPCGAVFEQQRGICGDRANAFVCRYIRYGWQARYIGIWGVSGFGRTCYASHALVEVYYDNGWHLIDPTYGGYFTNGQASTAILSMDDVLKNKYSPALKWNGAGSGLELLGFIQAHFAITYGWEEYEKIVSFMRN